MAESKLSKKSDKKSKRKETVVEAPVEPPAPPKQKRKKEDVVDAGEEVRSRKKVKNDGEGSGEPAEKKEKRKKKKKSKTVEAAIDEPAPALNPVVEDEIPKPPKNPVDGSSKKVKKLKPVVAPPTPEPEPVQDADSSDEEDAFLHGFSTDDEDSSDDEGYMDVEVSALDISKLPTVAKDDATVKHKLEKAKRQPTGDRGVLFLGRIPHGFYEDQLKAYFSQFGEITRLRVSRNKKTGQSKHYGFIEFDSSSVAQIVAETMDNYLLMGHIMRCKVIPKEQIHPELWVGANRRWRPVPKVRVAQAEHNKPRTPDEQQRAARRLLKRQQQRQRKLEKDGIVYDFGAVAYVKTPVG